jgi:hypothetical protein
MDTITKNDIDSLDLQSIPWHRMFTAYGTAEHYPEVLSVLEQTKEPEQWKKLFNSVSDFEHQGTMFPPAPFALAFLVRLLEKYLADETSDEIAGNLLDRLMYYAGVCNDAEKLEHAAPFSRISDLLDDGNLLSENHTEEDLEYIYENPEAISDQLFYSFYYYAGIVLSQIPGILDKYGRFPAESTALRKQFSFPGC